MDAHPEWMDQALAEATPEKQWVALRLKGGHDLFKGFENDELMRKLDQGDQFSKVTFDNNTYYNISVLERKPELEVVTFGAAKGPVLDELADRKLEPYYVQIRQNTPEAFQNADTSWKPFAGVREQVAALYYEPMIQALGKTQSKPEGWNGNRAAASRFLPYAKQAEKAIQSKPESANDWSKLREEPESLANQWKLEKSELHIKRKEGSSLLHQKELSLPVNAFSQVYDRQMVMFTFFQLKERTHNPNGAEALQEQVARTRFLCYQVKRSRSCFIAFCPKFKPSKPSPLIISISRPRLSLKSVLQPCLKSSHV